MKIIEMKNLGIFSLLLLLFLLSCQKEEKIFDINVPLPDPTIESYMPPVNNVPAGLIGFVVDENNTPVPYAIVTLNFNTTLTDAYGHFFIENETLNTLGALVKVQKEGYFEGSRKFFPLTGKQSRIKIQLLEKSFDKSFDAASGGTIAIGNGASVDFFPNSIKTDDGNNYTGTVRVASKWMDPSLSTTLDQMPGNLQGLNINQQIEQMALATYGMIAIELESDAGESLNIIDGKTATITMPLPTSIVSSAPSEIPLSSYNKRLGVWIEESSATLQGDKYVGDVSHLSFWNCNIPLNKTTLKLTLVDDNETPLNNYLVNLTLNNAATSGSGYTDQNGNLSELIPANKILTMNVFDVCGDIISTQNIGPFATNTNLENVTVSGTNLNATIITGNLLDCNGEPITNGVVVAEFNGQRIYHYPNTSNFSMIFSSCPIISDIEVTVNNPTDLERSNETTVAANVQSDIGNISVCGNQLENFISLTIDGVTAVFVNANASSAVSTYFYSISQDHHVGMGFGGFFVGDYTNEVNFETIKSAPLGWDFNIATFSSFHVTQLDTVLVGTFTGEVSDVNNIIFPMTGYLNINL